MKIHASTAKGPLCSLILLGISTKTSTANAKSCGADFVKVYGGEGRLEMKTRRTVSELFFSISRPSHTMRITSSKDLRVLDCGSRPHQHFTDALPMLSRIVGVSFIYSRL